MNFKLSSDLLELVLQAQKLSVSGHALTQVKSDDLSDKLSLVSFRFNDWSRRWLRMPQRLPMPASASFTHSCATDK